MHNTLGEMFLLIVDGDGHLVMMVFLFFSFMKRNTAKFTFLACAFLEMG